MPRLNPLSLNAAAHRGGGGIELTGRSINGKCVCQTGTVTSWPKPGVRIPGFNDRLGEDWAQPEAADAGSEGGHSAQFSEAHIEELVPCERDAYEAAGLPQ